MGKVIKCKFDRTLFGGNSFLDQFNKGDVKKGDTISVKEGSRMKFYVDASCFDDAIISTETKWAFIYDAYYNEGNTDQYNSLWADISGSSGSSSTPSDKAPDVAELMAKEDPNSPVTALGIGTQYKTGTEFVISPAGASFYYGFKQRVVVFTNDPGQEFYFFIIPYTEPNITYAYFDKNIRPFRFGDVVSLTICFHQYPDNIGGRGNYFANIYLLDKDDAGSVDYAADSLMPPAELTEKLTGLDLFKGKYKKQKLALGGARSGNINTYRILNFPLSIEWRDAGKKQRYLVPVVEVYEVVGKHHLGIEMDMMAYDSDTLVKFKNFAKEPTTSLQQYNQKLIGVESVETYQNQPNSEILVEYETMGEYMDRIETGKTQTIQYIGDIPYSQKEYDPCGYAQIIIKDESDSKRNPLTIFDEDKLSAGGDQTERSFDITAGDKKKTISITAEKLTNKNVACAGVLLPEGKKHEDIKNVFNMDIVLSALKDPKGGYVRVEDGKHKKQLKRSGTGINDANKTDTDVVVDDKKAPSGDVSDLQMIRMPDDYEYKEPNKFLLHLKYVYNKVLSIDKGEYDPNVIGTLFENAWLFNYLWLKQNLYQTYFVPVSTCRYPNQIARVRVFPDMKWTLLLKFNFEEADFQDFKKEYSYEVNAFVATASAESMDRATRTSVHAAGIQITKTTTKVPKVAKGGFKRLLEIAKRIEVSLTAEWENEKGTKEKEDIIEKFIKPFYDVIVKIYEIAKLVGDFTDGEANEEDRAHKSQMDEEVKRMMGGRSISGLLDVALKKSYETQILYPSVAVAVSWFFEDISDAKRPELEGRRALQINTKISAAPIIGISIKWDIIELLCRRHPLAFLIKKALDIGLYLLNPKNGVEVTFTVEGKLSLTGNFNFNLETGSSYSRGYSAKKEELISGDASVEADFGVKLAVHNKVYFIIGEIGAGGTVKFGAKTKIGNQAYFGADKDGLYISRQTYCDGLIFYLEAEAKLEVSFLGAKIIDWNPKYEPDPLKCGAFKLDWVKIYFNNSNKRVEVLDTNK